MGHIPTNEERQEKEPPTKEDPPYKQGRTEEYIPAPKKPQYIPSLEDLEEAFETLKSAHAMVQTIGTNDLLADDGILKSELSMTAFAPDEFAGCISSDIEVRGGTVEDMDGKGGCFNAKVTLPESFLEGKLRCREWRCSE